MAKACIATINGKESILNKELNRRFPGALNSAGENFYYQEIFTDAFKKELGGDWTSAEFRNKYPNIVNEQGEPRLIPERDRVYYITTKGTKLYPNPEFVLSTTDRIELSNSLLGEYLRSNSEDNPIEFIKNKLNSILDNYRKELDIYTEKQILGQLDLDEELLLLDNIDKINNKINSITGILNNPVALDLISASINSFKEEVGSLHNDNADEKEETDPTTIDDIANHTRESDTISYSANIDREIKRFLHIVPRQSVDDEGNVVNQYNGLTGLPLFLDNKEVENRVVNVLANVIEEIIAENKVAKDVYNKMIDKLTDRSDSDYIIRSFLDNINSYRNSLSGDDLIAFETKFVNSFYLVNNFYIFTEISVEDGKINISHVDPSVTQDSQTKLGNEYALSFLNKFYNRKDGKLKDVELLQNNLNILKNPKNFKQFRDALNALGFNISNRAALDIFENKDCLYPEYVANISNPTAKQLEAKKYSLASLVNDFINNNKVEYLYSEYDNKSKRLEKYKKEISGIDNIIKEFGSAKRAYQNEMIKGFSDKRLTRLIQTFAKYELPYKTSLSDNSLYVASEQRFMLGLISKLKKDILSLQIGDKHALEPLKRKWNLGNYYVDYLLAKDVAMNEGLDVSDPNSPGLFEDKHLEAIKDRVGMLRVVTNSEIKSKNDPDSVEYKSIGLADLIVSNISKLWYSQVEISDMFNQERKLSKRHVIKPLSPVDFSADKSSSFMIEGMPDLSNINITLDKSGENIESLGQYSDIFLNNFYGEYSRMLEQGNLIQEYLNIKPGDDIDPYEFAMKNFIPGYHYGNRIFTREDPLKEEDFLKGTWNKLGIFNGILRDKSNPYYESKILLLPINSLKLTKRLEKEEFREWVDSYIKRIAKEEVEKLKSVNIGGERNIFDLNTNIKRFNTPEMAFKFALASFVNNSNIFELFHGNIAFYKQSNLDKTNNNLDMVDALKRGPEILTDGLQFVIRKEENIGTYKDISGNDIPYNQNTHIPVAVFKSIESAKSKFSKQISEGAGKEMLYKHEIADAQGYITLEHHLEIIKEIWGVDKKDLEIYNRLKNPNHKVNEEDIKWLKLAGRSTAPLKLVGYSLIPHNIKINKLDINLEFPMYLKYSTAVLSPAIVKGTEMEKLLLKMEEMGIKQVVAKSGSKDSNLPVTEIANYDSEGIFSGLKDDMELNAILFPKKDLKLQVELPNKFDKEGAIGTQIINNLLANFLKKEGVENSAELDDTKKNYIIGDKLYTAKEMYEEYEEAIKDILQDQLDSFIKKTGLTIEMGEVKFDETVFRNLLIQQLDSVKDIDLIDVLSDPSIPLEGVPGLAQRGFPIISKYIKKNVSNINTNTASVIQVANIGFDRISKEVENQVIYLTKDRKLRPPLPETDENGNIKYYNADYTKYKTEKDDEYNKMKIKNARVFLPFLSIYRRTGMSYKELKEKLEKNPNFITRDVLENVIGYRIPNQSISSNDAIEIAGILPPQAGDQAIVYNEITGKTGSDFDIDKMYLIMPSLFVLRNDDGSVKKIDINNNLNSRAGKQNRLIKAMRAILNSGVTYNDLISELDSKIMKETINEIEYIKTLSKEDRIKFEKMSPEEKKDAIFKFNIQNELDPLQQLGPYSLSKARVDMLQAKQLVATTANHMSDISISQISNMFLDLNLGLTNNDFNRIFVLGEENNSEMKITKIVSYLMNAAVDAAKDNFIIRGNFNTYTANAAMVMFRLGYSPKQVFSILMNDDILKLSEEKNLQTQKFANVKPTYNQEQLNNFSKLFIKNFKNKTIEPEKFLTGEYDTETVLGFWNLLTIAGKELNNNILTTKFFSSGAGSNIYDHLVLKNRLERGKVEYIRNREYFTSNLTGEDVQPQLTPQQKQLATKENPIQIYADGSDIKGTGQIGFGVYFEFNGKEFEYSDIANKKDFGDKYNISEQELINAVSNPTMELMAAVEALEQFKDTAEHIEIINDYEGVKAWITGTWKAKKPYIQDLVTRAKDLISQIEKNGGSVKITTLKEHAGVKSHSGHWGNDNADRLAKLREFKNNFNDLYNIDYNTGEITSEGDNLSTRGEVRKVFFKKLYKNGITDPSSHIFEFDPDLSKYTFSGAAMNNSLLLVNLIGRKMFIELTPAYSETINKISQYLGDPLTVSADNIKLISNNLYPFVISNFIRDENGNRVYNLSKEESLFLLNNFPNRILELKRTLPSNEFLRELYIDNNTGFISFPNYKNYEPLQKMTIKDSVEDLYEMIDEDGNNIGRKFIDNLVQYSFLTTGFKQTYFSFNEFLPKSYFINRYHAIGIKNMLDSYNNLDAIKDQDVITAIKMIGVNNPTNYKIAKNMSKKYESNRRYVNREIGDGKLIVNTPNQYKKSDGTYSLFIRIQGDPDEVYMLSGIDNTIEGKPRPRYRRINTPSMHTENPNIRKLYNPNLVSDVNLYVDNSIEINDDSDASISGLELQEVLNKVYISEFDNIIDPDILDNTVSSQPDNIDEETNITNTGINTNNLEGAENPDPCN